MRYLVQPNVILVILRDLVEIYGESHTKSIIVSLRGVLKLNGSELVKLSRGDLILINMSNLVLLNMRDLVKLSMRDLV